MYLLMYLFYSLLLTFPSINLYHSPVSPGAMYICMYVSPYKNILRHPHHAYTRKDERLTYQNTSSRINDLPIPYP